MKLSSVSFIVFNRSAISHQSFALLLSLQALIIWESWCFDRVCLSKTRLVADSLEKSRLLVLIFQGFVPLKCIYSRRIPLVAGFSKYVARRALQTCLRGRFGPWLVPPSSCLWGEKSNKCNQFICAFFHNNKRLIKKHTAGERNAGSSPELVGRQVPTWAAVSVWVVGGVPSCARCAQHCPASPPLQSAAGT